MKTLKLLIVYLAALFALAVILAPTMTEEPCFTDTCVGCTTDCLDSE